MASILESGKLFLCQVVWFFLIFMLSYAVEAAVVDRILAVVDVGVVSEKAVKPQIITESDVEEMARPVLARIAKERGEVDAGMIRKKVLDELILRILREQKAEQLGVLVEQKDIDAIMSQVEHNNHLPMGALPDALAKQGIDLEQYKQGLRDQLMKSRLINKVIRPLVSVSPEEIQNLYKAGQSGDGPQEVRLGQILLAVDGTSSAGRVEEKGKLAEKLYQQLQEGASLATLAGQYSDDPSGLQGGVIGWFKRGELMPEMEAVVFSMTPGEVAKPFRTAQGFHILSLLEKRQVVSRGKSGGEKVKVKARHLLIKVPVGSSNQDEAQALKTIQKIRQELVAGGDFAALARKYSQDETAKEGGDLQWFGSGMMVAPFEEVAFRLHDKELSEPVRTPFGWHLILVEERKILAADSLDAQAKELEERVLETKLQARYNQWLRDLRLRAYVEYR